MSHGGWGGSEKCQKSVTYHLNGPFLLNIFRMKKGNKRKLPSRKYGVFFEIVIATYKFLFDFPGFHQNRKVKKEKRIMFNHRAQNS